MDHLLVFISACLFLSACLCRPHFESWESAGLPKLPSSCMDPNSFRLHFTSIGRIYPTTTSIVIVQPKATGLQQSRAPSLNPLRSFVRWNPNSRVNPDISSDVKHFGSIGFHTREEGQKSINATFLWFIPRITLGTITTSTVTVTVVSSALTSKMSGKSRPTKLGLSNNFSHELQPGTMPTSYWPL